MTVITLWWAEHQLSGPLIEWATRRATNVATSAINRSLSAHGEMSLDTEDLIVFSGEGSATPVIHYNMGLLNRIMSDMVERMMVRVEELTPVDLSVPMGELSGMTLLAGRGPALPVRIILAGSITAEPKVDFQSAGVNQVSHRIFMDVEVNMMIVAPFVKKPIVVRQPIMLADAIFPGEVPGTYINLVGYSGPMTDWLALIGAIEGLDGSSTPGERD